MSLSLSWPLPDSRPVRELAASVISGNLQNKKPSSSSTSSPLTKTPLPMIAKMGRGQPNLGQLVLRQWFSISSPSVLVDHADGALRRLVSHSPTAGFILVRLLLEEIDSVYSVCMYVCTRRVDFRYGPTRCELSGSGQQSLIKNVLLLFTATPTLLCLFHGEVMEAWEFVVRRFDMLGWEDVVL